MAEYLSIKEGESPTLDVNKWMHEWEVDLDSTNPGGIKSNGHSFSPSIRQIYLLQRKTTKHGKDLGKTTGWIHR